MWTRKELKTKAKVAFKANYWRCVFVALILSALFGGGLSFATGFGTAGLNTAAEPVNALNINGEDYDISTIDGADVTKALNAISEGLADGKLTVNGEDIEVTDTEKIAALQAGITNLQAVGLEQYSHTDLAKGLLAIVMLFAGVLLLVAIIAVLLDIFLFNPLIVGCEGFFMANSRGKASLGELKRGFSPRWIHTVGTMLLRDIFLCLWALLFIIPAIVKSYAYAMVPFILADEPELGAREAITRSREMMKGNKWKAFVLDLSFIGWAFLSVITFGLVGVFYFYPYACGTHAELYNTLKAAE